MAESTLSGCLGIPPAIVHLVIRSVTSNLSFFGFKKKHVKLLVGLMDYLKMLEFVLILFLIDDYFVFNNRLYLKWFDLFID